MRTAIVTGATKGIGRAIVDALTADGWRLGLVARNREDLLQLVAETDCGHIAFVGSVTDSAFIDATVDQMVAEFGHLDAMVANAVLTDWMVALSALRNSNWVLPKLFGSQSPAIPPHLAEKSSTFQTLSRAST